MKLLLKLFLFLVVLSGLAVFTISLVLYFSSSMQRSITVRVLEASTDGEVQLERVRLGLGRADVRGLRIERPDGTLHLASLEALFDTWSLFGAQPRIEMLRLSGTAQVPDAPPVEFELSLDELESGLERVYASQATLEARISNVDPALSYGVNIISEIQLDLPKAEASFAGPITLSAPETETNGSVSGSFNFGGEAPHAFGLDLEADQLSLNEWLPVLMFLSGEETAGPRDPKPDEAPPWALLDGKATMRLDSVHAGTNTFTDLALVAEVEDGKRLNIRGGGKSGSAPLSIDAALDFQADHPRRPYVLSGSVDVQGFEVSPFLKEPHTRQPPILEGAFDLSGTFQSTAPNPGFLVDRMIGSARLQSASKGTFRPLGEKTSLAGGVSGLLGSLTGSIRELAWVQLVIDQLKEIPYSRMQFEVTRKPNLDFALQNLDLVSRETRIQGEGTLDFSKEVPLFQMPIDMRFQLSAKGRLAEALRTGNQLRSEEPDSLGFLKGPPLPIKGTLGEPESLLMNTLMESGSQLLPGLFR